MTRMKKQLLPLAAGILLLSCVSQHKASKRETALSASSNNSIKADTAKADSTKKPVKPYKDIITAKAATQNGLFKVHKVGDKWYFEMVDSLFDRDILVVNRVSKAPAGERAGYAGDWIGENVIRFDRGPGDKVFMRRVSYVSISKDSSENGMVKSILNSSVQPIVASFDIKAFSPDSTGAVIDMTAYLNTDNVILGFLPSIKKELYGLDAFQADRSYIERINSFPLNTEIKTVKTYTAGNDVRTYELNNSLVLLPSQVMKPRYFDKRVGYFSRGYLNYDAHQRVKANYVINRWRLEPKKEDREKYKRGELVEPEKPIVFYIDPATPKKWVPYLMQGVNAWQAAFEKAGFKNAIYALEVPENTAWSLEDARHNVIVYKASVVQNASGPQVSDPRSGEVLESHINWYHNVQKLLHDWYFIQASGSDPVARKMEYPDSLMGKLIRYVCMHEIGHTLGLQHNFSASAAVPVDSLRSKSYIAANGHTPSIMDYARFNYVAQPEDGIAANDLIPGIGVYDKWAIEWGYRWLPEFETADEEQTFLNKWIIRKLADDKRLFFVDTRANDPRNQMEDLGDDAMKAGAYGIKNLQRIVANLKEWTRTPNSDYTDYEEMYVGVLYQYKRYLGHVLNNIGPMYHNPRTVEQGDHYFSFPDREKARAAVSFFNENLFTTPSWLINAEMFLNGTGGGVIQLYKYQEFYVHSLLYPARWNALVFGESILPKDKSYTYDQLLTDLEAEIWKELKDHKPIDMYRRNLQKTYACKLVDNIRLSGSGDMAMLDAFTILVDHSNKLHAKIKAAIPGYTDPQSRAHLADIGERLKAVMYNLGKTFPEWPRLGNGMMDRPQAINITADTKDMPVLGNEWNKKSCWSKE